MQSNSQTVNIGSFISVASQLALSACEIIKEASQNTSLQKFQKGHDDPVTEADYHVQTMIINGLSKFFPGLKIVGEQTVDYKGEITVDFQGFHSSFCPEGNKFGQIQVPIDELCVWIDPIDCTKGFIKGEMDLVTVLIGLSRNKASYAGVVGVPYKKTGQNTRQYCPSVTIGVTQSQQAYTYWKNQTVWKQIHSQPKHQPILLTTTKTRVDTKFKQLMQHFKADGIYAGGSGRKIMMVINGQADLLAYMSVYTHMWDSCAGQAIIKAMGGYFLTKKGESLVYDAEGGNYHNKDGQICTMDKGLLDEFFEFYGQFKGETE